MDTTTLRSFLQHVCSDLRNLTNAELEEAKWLTKKKVLQQLFSIVPLLQEQSDALLDLNEIRNDESANQKRNGSSKEERIESESKYRTKFMRIVLDGLTDLRWPPSQEAFSDPLDSLFNDKIVFFDAVEYLIRVGIPGFDLGIVCRTPTSHLKSGTPPPVAKEYLGPSPAHHQTSNVLKPGTSTFDDSISMISYAPSEPRGEFSPEPAVGVAYDAPNRSDMYSGRSNQFGAEVERSMSIKERSVELNWKAFEVLQKQNEMLSVRLRDLQRSVLKRDEAEAKIAGILAELKSTVGEIVEAGGSATSASMSTASTSFRKGKSGGDQYASASIVRELDASLASVTGLASCMSKEQEMENFRQEVEREKAEEESKKDKTLGIGAASTHKGGGKAGGHQLCTNCSAKLSSAKAATPSFTSGRDNISSNVLWSRVHRRLLSLEEQWVGAQRNTRRFAEGTSTGSPSLRPNKSPGTYHANGVGGGSSSRDGGGVIYASTRTPSRSLVHQTLGVQRAISRAGVEPSPGAGAFTDADVFSSPPQPPHSSNCSRSQVSGIGAADASGVSSAHNFGMDLARLHLLQRDLIAFAERAHSLTASTVFPEGGDCVPSSSTTGRGLSQSQQHPDVLPDSVQAARHQQDSADLQMAAWELILHLSAVSPVAPLSLHSPFRSCVSGLEALIQELTQEVYPKVSKNTQMRLQAASDRALSEQIAVVRCYRQARSCLKQWVDHASSASPKVRSLGERFRSTIERTAGELEGKALAITQVYDALESAELSRVPSSSRGVALTANVAAADDDDLMSVNSSTCTAHHRGKSLVNPLEALARGSAGKEVAALVNALRLHRVDLEGISTAVHSLGGKLASELRRELEFMGRTAAGIDHAAQTTKSFLSTPMPGQNAHSSANSGRQQQQQQPVSARQRAGTGPTSGSSRRMASSASEAPSCAKSDISSRPPFNLSIT